MVAQNPEGCFQDDFLPKSAVIPPFIDYVQNPGRPNVTVTVFHQDTLSRVSKYVFGNNANTYMTQMVTQPVLLDHIRSLSPHLLRYPGGNLSSLFFWDAPKNQPPPDAPSLIADADGNLVNAGYWYGRNTESWTLSVDNYYEMLCQTGNTGMITVNYGYARYGTGPAPARQAAHHAADWVRYDNGRTRFWEIGNESGGPWQAGFRINKAVNQDNQPEIISGELYGEHFNIFADSLKAAAAEKGHQIYVGAQLLPYDAGNSWNPPDRTWNDGFFSRAGNRADFFIVHSYFTPYNENSGVQVILNSATTETASMMQYLKTYTSGKGMDMKPVALTEWNIFAVGSKQSCSFINGMHAAIVLGEMIRLQYGQASRWNLANAYDNGNDHGMFNNRDEPGVPAWNPRPVFFCMYYFQKFFGDHMVRSTVSGNSNILAYASKFATGETGIVIVNKGVSAASVKLAIPGFGYGDRYYLYSLTGGTDNYPFSQSVHVNDYPPDNLTGGPISSLETIPARSELISGNVILSSPALSVQFILVEDGPRVIDGTREVEAGFGSVYPNPARDRVTIASEREIHRIELVSPDGVVVRSFQLQGIVRSCQMDLPAAPGIHLLKIYSGERISVSKLVIPD